MAHTPGPWPIDFTGDGKRICVGVGCVEGPHGYDVAEVYSDDCDRNEAIGNALLIGAAPELLEVLQAIRDWDEGVNPAVYAGLSAELRAQVYAAIAKAGAA